MSTIMQTAAQAMAPVALTTLLVAVAVLGDAWARRSRPQNRQKEVKTVIGGDVAPARPRRS